MTISNDAFSAGLADAVAAFHAGGTEATLSAAILTLLNDWAGLQVSNPALAAFIEQCKKGGTMKLCGSTTLCCQMNASLPIKMVKSVSLSFFRPRKLSMPFNKTPLQWMQVASLRTLYYMLNFQSMTLYQLIFSNPWN